MEVLKIIVLAIVQGLTEFLPISSDGHLVVANALLEAFGSPPAKDLMEVTIALHMGTLAAVLWHYRREIVRLLGADRKVIPLILVGSIPAAIVGLSIKKGPWEDWIQHHVLENVLIAGLMFPVTAAFLIYGSRRLSGTTDYPQANWKQALLIGLAQAWAILPGASRSGSTIPTALGLGFTPLAATSFSFLMSIPAVAGAGLLELLDVMKAGTTSTSLPTLLLGFAISFVVGLGALRLLVKFVQRGKLSLFAWYLIPLGAAVVAWQLGK
jgi:undecaprenyl-diphosphatase